MSLLIPASRGNTAVLPASRNNTAVLPAPRETRHCSLTWPVRTRRARMPPSLTSPFRSHLADKDLSSSFTSVQTSLLRRLSLTQASLLRIPRSVARVCLICTSTSRSHLPCLHTPASVALGRRASASSASPTRWSLPYPEPRVSRQVCLAGNSPNQLHMPWPPPRSDLLTSQTSEVADLLCVPCQRTSPSLVTPARRPPLRGHSCRPRVP